jgi:hypothetical protein
MTTKGNPGAEAEMERPRADYPAAHSMDTEWYAVDRDGHVALFDSGEAGAMPIGAHTEHETHRDDLAKLVPEPPYHLLDWLGEDNQEHHVGLDPPARPVDRDRPGRRPLIFRKHDQFFPDFREEKGLGPTLLFLRSLDLIEAEAGPYPFAHAPASEGVAVYIPDLSPWLAWKLHEAGHCLGCFRWPGEGNPWDLRDDLPARLGLFYYQHDPKAENWISGRYLRKEPPGHPLRIDQLPTEIREAIGKVRFVDLRFSEAESLQPIDFLPCDSWQSNYLDADGVTVRPIPGREANPHPGRSLDLLDDVIEIPPGQEPPLY